MHRHTLCPAAAASLRLLAATVVLLSLPACSDAPSPPAEASGQLPQLERLPLIGGVDADNDGVRDDIADHIRQTYTDPVQYRAAMQVARAYQNQLLVDKHDHIALQAASEQMMRAIACVNRRAFAGDGGERQSLRLMDELEAMTTNTKERLQAYLAYNKARSGSMSVRAEGEVCE
ncbi:MAG: hypothetical protein EP308_02680 [Burkholderiales bacterium]|nr:MAG: hypothetical protein EP308_02680 [Burkholderiales bacterium]